MYSLFISYQVIVLDANRALSEMEEEFQRCKTRIFPQQHRREQENSVASSVPVVGGHSL
jgi:hypothetical protein